MHADIYFFHKKARSNKNLIMGAMSVTEKERETLYE